MTAQLDHGHEDTQLAKLELRLHADHLTSARPMCSIGALEPGARARRLLAPMRELARFRSPAARRRRPAGIRRAEVGEAEQPCDGDAGRRAARRLALEQPAGHPREAHVDRARLPLASRPARERVQGRGGAQTGRAGDREARELRLHRDHARGGAASCRPPDAGHRRPDHQPLHLDDGPHGGRSRIRHLGRLRCDRHLRPHGPGRAPCTPRRRSTRSPSPTSTGSSPPSSTPRACSSVVRAYR